MVAKTLIPTAVGILMVLRQGVLANLTENAPERLHLGSAGLLGLCAILRGSAGEGLAPAGRQTRDKRHTVPGNTWGVATTSQCQVRMAFLECLAAASFGKRWPLLRGGFGGSVSPGSGSRVVLS